MKILLRRSIGGLLCSLLSWACTNKEINLITNIDFEVAISSQEVGFVRDSLATQITVSPESTKYPDFVYSLQYKVTSGSGYFVTADQGKLNPEEKYALNPEHNFTADWNYIGTTPGIHTISILAQDNFEKHKPYVIQYELKNLDLLWEATTTQTTTKIGDTLELNLNLVNNDVERLVTFEYVPRLNQGSGVFLDRNKQPLSAANANAIIEGVTNLYFVPRRSGAALLFFDLTDSNGQELRDTLELTVLEETENIPPVAIVELGDGLASEGVAPYEVSFVGANSVDTDGTILSYLWQFDDNDATATTENPMYIFQNPGTYVVQLTVTDNEALQNKNIDSNTLTIIVEETMSPDLLANNDAIELEWNQEVVVPVLENDEIVAGSTVTVSNVTNPLNGTTTIAIGQQTITYTPAKDFSGIDRFMYTITDVDGNNSTAQVEITVSMTNAKPVTVDDVVTTNENTAVVIPVLENDTDLDSQVLQIATTTNPTNGTIVQNTNGTITYIPNRGFDGSDTFNYSISDSVNESKLATVTITVINVNQPPVAEDFEKMTNDLEAITITILDHVMDEEKDPITVLQATALNGEVLNNGDGTITYTPVVGFGAVDEITYIVNDGILENDGSGKIRVVIEREEIVKIPDIAFERELIVDGIDSDNLVNGQISRKDVEKVSVLDARPINNDILDFTGLNAFTNLIEFIGSKNNVCQIDFRNNKKLKEIILFPTFKS